MPQAPSSPRDRSRRVERLDPTWLAPRPPRATDVSSPASALAELLRGNERFVRGELPSVEPSRRMGARTAPLAAVLTCADAPIACDEVFGCGGDQLFVTAVAANAVDRAVLGSIEFAVSVLGAPVVFVLGHAGCLAIDAEFAHAQGTASASPEVPVDAGGDVTAERTMLRRFLRRATALAAGDRASVEEYQVRCQLDAIAHGSPVIARRLREGSLLLAGGVLDPFSGRIAPVELSRR